MHDGSAEKKQREEKIEEVLPNGIGECVHECLQENEFPLV